jgi:amino acid adenylation domain-containing protein
VSRPALAAGSTVGELFELTARRCADAVAVVGAEVALTYPELLEHTTSLCARLRELGIGPGDVVLTLLPKHEPDCVVAALAVWRCGATLLAVDPALPQARRATLADTAAGRLLIRRDQDGTGLDLSYVDGSRPAAGPAAAYLIFTSGSTGRPKPVVVGHDSMLAIHRAWQEVYGLTTRPRGYLQVAGLSFDVFIADLARTVLSGGRLVLCPTEIALDPPALLELATRTRADSVELTPSVLRLLTDWAQRRDVRIDLDLVVVGGEQWHSADLAALRRVIGPDTRVVNTYGITETTVDSTYLDVTETELERIGSTVPIGRPFPGVVTAVLDARARPVPDGVVGELHIAGPTLATGYLDLPEETAKRFIPSTIGGSELMYRTGDLVRVNESGDLVVVGRVDDEVKLSGVRVHPDEVESVLRAASGRFGLDGAVVCVDRTATLPRLLGFVSTGGRPVAVDVADRLRQALAEQLPSAMVPVRIEPVERFPLTAAGKVDRAALLATTAPGQAAPPAPADPVLAAVYAAWADVLGFPPSEPGDDLFASGADSLAAARIAAGIAARLGVRVSVADVLARRTASGLADLAATATPWSQADEAAQPNRFAASTAASALWLLHQLDRADATYHLPTVLEIDGELSVPALRQAIDLVVDRHDALRCAFTAGRDGAQVHVADHCAVPLPVEQVDAADVAERIDAIVAAPFDLAQAPLLRARLLRIAPLRHVLVIVVHHIVFDGWSESVFLDELGTCYRAGRPDELPPAATVPRSAAGPSAASLAFWRRQLAGWPGPAALAEPVTASGDAPPHRARAVLGAHAVRSLARAGGTTAYTVMLAALAVLIARRSGSADLVIGTPLGARTTRTGLRSIGFQVASVPVRLDVGPQASFQAVVDHVRDQLIGAFAHADAALPDIVAELGLSGSGRRNPLFNQWFNWLGAPASPPQLDGLTVRLAEPPVPGALFDVCWYVTETADGFAIDLVTAAEALPAEETTELLAQYLRVLDQLAGAPARAVAEADLRTPRARRVLPSEDADLRTDPPALLPVLHATLTSRPEAPVVRAPDGTWTGGELLTLAEGLATRLRRAGVGAGDVVVIHAHRCGGLVLAVLAVLRAGARFALLDAHLPPLRLAAQAVAVGASVGIATGAPPELPDTTLNWLPVAGPDGGAAEPVDAGQSGYVLFTSGTSGRPRGVLGGTAPLANFLAWYCREHRIGPADRVAMLSGLAHDPLLRDLLVPLYSGACCWIPPDELLFAPRQLLRWLRDSAITIAHLTPSLARALAGTADAGQVPSLRLVTCAGEILSGADATGIRSWAPNARIVNGYGATETPQLVAARDADPAAGPRARLAVGSGTPGAQLLIRSATGRQAAIGEPGEIVVRSPYLATGAIGEPLDTEPDPLPEHRRYRSGDLGRYQADGSVVIHGRIGGDRREIQGHRVDLGEIDAALRSLPGVCDAAAAVSDGPDGSALVIAYVVPDAEVTGADLDAAIPRYLDQLRAILPAYCVPVLVEPLDTLPRTRNGKIDRAALPAPSPAARPPASAPVSVASDTVQRAVHDVWCELLRRAEVPLNTNLFELGASSLTMLTAHGAIERALDRRLAPMALFQFPTIQSLAAHLRGADPAGPATGNQPRVPANSRRTADMRDRRRAARRLARQQEESR